MLRYGMSIQVRRQAQILVGVNGCYVTEFFSHFGCCMGMVRTEVQRALCEREKEDTIFVRMSLSSGWVTLLHAVLACTGDMQECLMCEESSRRSLACVCVSRVDGECTLCVVRVWPARLARGRRPLCDCCCR